MAKKPKKPVPESIKKAAETKSGLSWGLSEILRWYKCKCDSWTLRALCDAVEVVVDPRTLTEDDEVIAAILGIRTYQVWGVIKERAELKSRLSNVMFDWMNLKPASEVDVLAPHECGRPPIGTGGNPRLFAKKPPVDYTADPPY